MKGRRRRSEKAVSRRAGTRGPQRIGRRRVMVTADRGFAAVALGEGVSALGVEVIIRVQGSPKVCVQGQGRHLHPLGVAGNTRPRTLGRVAYCESAPHRLWVTLSRAREAKGSSGI